MALSIAKLALPFLVTVATSHLVSAVFADLPYGTPTRSPKSILSKGEAGIWGEAGVWGEAGIWGEAGVR